MHPFYSDGQISAPGYEEVAKALIAAPGFSATLENLPITRKERLAEVTTKLSRNTMEARSFRSGAIIGITGGGSGKGDPMPFFTDAQETRAIRAYTGHLLVKCGIAGDGDLAIVLNTTGNLYRSLSIISETLEHAGVSTLMAGHSMDPDRLVRTCQQLQPNVLAGAPSQLIQLARHVSKTRADICFDKIIYTSEMLPVQQRMYLDQVFGGTRGPLFYGSIYGSAEAGPWAVANHALTGHHAENVDLIYDKRAMIVEIVPQTSRTANQDRGSKPVETVPDGTAGIIVLTSLQKLRHPLVRYYTGDIGSLHDLTPEIRDSVGDGSGSLRILRFYGRDRAESFKWQANFYEITAIGEAMNAANWGVFDWQIVLDIKKDTGEHTMEVRVIREEQSADVLTQSQLRSELSAFFNVYPKVDHLFHLRSVGLEDMVRSETAGKIIRLVDHTK
ncbi:hypothetical protein yc1106_06670 [Curvularia clavata]|uniref:Uncharacterized protein n=1 Tax=Curvularia clavata TaxID=95742 RepID=A0A9Q8ZBY1_CURCL|nr:hypothetical protein yc1106_06670 [Curvularia clavata]